MTRISALPAVEAAVGAVRALEADRDTLASDLAALKISRDTLAAEHAASQAAAAETASSLTAARDTLAAQLTQQAATFATQAQEGAAALAAATATRDTLAKQVATQSETIAGQTAKLAEQSKTVWSQAIALAMYQSRIVSLEEQLADRRRLILDVPAAIASDGSTDVGAVLSAWLSRVPVGTLVRFAENGDYRIDDAAVIVDALSGVEIDFRGATLRRTRILDHHLRYTEATPYLYLKNCAGVTVRNLLTRGVNTNNSAVIDSWPEVVRFATNTSPLVPSVTGGDKAVGWRNGYKANKAWVLNRARTGWQWCEISGPTSEAFIAETGGHGAYSVALEFEAAIRSDGGSNLIVEDCDLDGMFGDGVQLQGTAGVQLRRLTITRNGRQGIATVSGTDILIEDCTITSRRAAIDLEPDVSTRTLRRIEIRRCRLRSQLLAIASGGPGGVHDVNIHHNDIYESGTPVLHVSGSQGADERRNWRFEDNTVHFPAAGVLPTVRLDNVRGAVVARNRIPRRQGTGPAVGFHTAASHDIEVYDNVFPGHLAVVGDRAGGSTWTERSNSLT